MVHHSAVELEGARHVGLATEDLDEAVYAGHGDDPSSSNAV
jgi:hypothetical protein